MAKELFSNVGKDIKNIARTTASWTLAWYVFIGLIIVVCGCVLLAEGLTLGWVSFLIALGIIAYGYSKSRLEVMRLFAYGEIADRLISLDSKISGNPPTTKGNGIFVKPEKKAEYESLRRTSPWECQFCGHQNPAETRFCKSCGTEDIGV